MDLESDTFSGWFILKAGFKVQAQCPSCHSPRISYHKVRVTGMKGISSSSKGLTPVCIDCGKGLPKQGEKEVRGNGGKRRLAVMNG